MRLLQRFALMSALTVGIGIAAAVYLSPAESQTTLTVSPAITTTALSTTSASIVGTNATRKQIVICNPSTIVEWIAPAPATAVANAGVGLPAVSTGTTVCVTYTAQAGSSIGNGFNAIAASGTPNITVLEMF